MPERQRLSVLGIMSGTSLDGVDYAICRIDDASVQLREHWRVRFPSALRRRLLSAAKGASTSHEVAQLHHDLGRFYARHAARDAKRLSIDLAGVHGQTIFHRPRPAFPATFQIGEPAYLAEALGAAVVSNFRAADLAAGGEGAPLATGFHVAIFGERGRHVCVNNLGGISNVTSIDWRRGRRPSVLAFDTGPANLLLNSAVEYFSNGRRAMDRNGAWAARGVVSKTLLERWLRHPYFRLEPAKSTGREMFGERLLRRYLEECRRGRLTRWDALATLTQFSARSLALNYRLHLPGCPGKVVLTGGGARNGVLVEAIRSELKAICGEIDVLTCERLGWPPESIEPAAFAWLAYQRIKGRPGAFPETTGARRAATLGQVSLP